MEFFRHPQRSACRLLSLAIGGVFGLLATVHAAPISFASVPLSTATTSTVLPNLLFVMDNSGSMSQDYTPDYLLDYSYRYGQWTNDWDWRATGTANMRNCKDSADEDGAVAAVNDFTKYVSCAVGDVPYMSSAINVQYYNPEIRYYPGVNSDGSSYPSQTDPTNVLSDGYGKHDRDQLGNVITTINLTTSYPDRIWCTKNNPTAAEKIDTTVCRKNSDYLYPDATFKYGRDSNATVNNKDVLGVLGAPYYYKVVVTEYCSEAELRNCVSSSTPTGIYTFPAVSRWCTDNTLATCQLTKTATYKYPRYPGSSITAVSAVGTITLTSRTAGVGTAGRNVTSIKLGPALSGVEILGAPINGAAGMASTTLAANIAAQINAHASSPEYTAIAVGNLITITGTAAAGATANGTLTATATAGTVTSSTNFTGGVTGANALPYTFARVDIVPATTSYAKGIARSDCAGATCTYAEEITNFANWYAYYRTRMQAMKSSASRAFQPIGSNYRVGFINICDGSYLPINKFDNSVAAIAAVAAVGTVTLTSRSAGSGTLGRNLTGITVGGVQILGATVSGATGMSSVTLAANIAAQINTYSSNPEYTATSSGNVITITSTLAAGAAGNGTLSTTYSGTNPVSSKTNASGGVTGVGQKTKWFQNLFAQTASGCGTPLRSALSTAGRIYAGKYLSVAGSSSGATIDPVQYSCQQNFTLLTTDGYWNGAGGVDLAGAAVGNLDAAPGVPRPLQEGSTATSGTLADIAKYYYDTDLRTTALNNCTGSLGLDVCTNNVFVGSSDNNPKQHMTTFTLGLGVDGELSYTSDYATATAGDFYNLKTGVSIPTVNWPTPVADSASAIDDLWHAAVNGNGTYFSAKDPAQLSSGLAKALSAIGSRIGAASAAATSRMNPVPGDNLAFVAAYSTIKWTGNLEGRPIDVTTGEASQTATWCVESVKADTCSAPSSVVADASGADVIYRCHTPDSNADSCVAPGVLDGTVCKVEIANTCVGSLPGRVAAASDTRNIYKNNGAGGLQDFVYANLNAADFAASGLSQWSVYDASQKTAAAGANLVNFLRGQTGYEDRGSNPAANRLYRFREAVMGDTLESEPAFIGKPVFSYTDPGYSDYKVAQASRAGTVFVGSNDGMLHAFDATTGSERWAYVPSAVIPNLWKLADINYSANHQNYVNGSPIVTDVCVANCSCNDACVAGGGDAPVWKTILVSGLNAGGRSYFALDVTDPATPALLWEVTSASVGFSNLGYSFGQPVVTKKADGTWVVLLTSGYNNTTPGDGKGYLFVVNAVTGALISSISTGVGDTTTPSGLSRIAAWNEFGGVDNTAGYVYGGDLLGNIWRFDINTAGAPFKLATLKDGSDNAQPITITPVLGKIDGKRIVMVGTGKYLEVSDLETTAQQTVYAISDDDETVTLTDPRSSLVAQTLTKDAGTGDIFATNNAVNWAVGRGWYSDLPETGERVHIDMKLLAGTLKIATAVPSSTVCAPGGRSNFYYLDYKTGGSFDPDVAVGKAYSDLIVGITTIVIDGIYKDLLQFNTGKPSKPITPPVTGSAGTFTGKRVMWRELIQ